MKHFSFPSPSSGTVCRTSSGRERCDARTATSKTSVRRILLALAFCALAISPFATSKVQAQTASSSQNDKQKLAVSSSSKREMHGDSEDSNDNTSSALSALPIDLASVRRVKVAGTLVSEAPMRVGNLDILAPIVGDDSALLAKLGSTASLVAPKNIPGNLNTPTNAQWFQLNLAPRPPIILTIGQATAYIDGQAQQLRTAPLLMGGKIWLPIFSIAPLLGAAVRLQPDGTLNITPTVQSVELFPANGYTVLTVKTSAPIPRDSVLKGTMDNPPKLYFDFPGYSMGFDANNSTGERVVTAGINDVQQVRAGMPQSFPDKTRIALDLKRDMKATVQILPDKTIFAVLLSPSGSAQPTLPPRDVDVPVALENRRNDSSLRGVTIVIDAGHGGYDSGAPGRLKLQASSGIRNIRPGVTASAEKHYTLDMAQRLRGNLENRGATVLMTRDGDVFIPLQGRVDFANSRHADIFFSIHIDSFRADSTGTTTHFYTAQSQPLAREVQSELARATGLKSRGVEQSRFFVIRKTTMPSVLTESCFITNSREEALLMNPNWRQRVASGMAQGIANYVAKYGVRN